MCTEIFVCLKVKDDYLYLSELQLSAGFEPELSTRLTFHLSAWFICYKECHCYKLLNFEELFDFVLKEKWSLLAYRKTFILIQKFVIIILFIIKDWVFTVPRFTIFSNFQSVSNIVSVCFDLLSKLFQVPKYPNKCCDLKFYHQCLNWFCVCLDSYCQHHFECLKTQTFNKYQLLE